MVILIFKGPDTLGMQRRTVLRQILKTADHETHSLTPGRDMRNEGAANLIHLIKATTVGAANAPQSRKARRQEQRSSVEAWENEGGSIAGSPLCPIA